MAAQTIETSMLAKLLDITPRHVIRLTNDGVLSRAIDNDGNELRGRYSLLAVRDYCRYLRGQMRVGDTGQATWEAARNKRMSAEAEMSDLRVREYKGLLHNARDVEFVITNMMTYFKQRALAFPSRVARLCVGKNFRQILEILSGEIELLLRELSGYDASKFTKQDNDYLESEAGEAGDNGSDDGDKSSR
jgi:hypothetical protein